MIEKLGYLKQVNESRKERGNRRFLERMKERTVFGYYRRRLREDGFIKKQVMDNEMFLFADDTGISLDLALYGVREEEHTSKFKQTIAEGDTVLDIGANIGYYALIASEQVGEAGKICALEPIPSNVSLLKKNLSHNDIDNVEVFQMACGENSGSKEINLSDKSNLHSFNEIPSAEGETLEVEVVTVDDFVEKEEVPDLIRMDVEGYEHHILKGAKSTLTEHNPNLFIEFHPDLMEEQDMEECIGILESAGYDVSTLERRKNHGNSFRAELIEE